MEKTSSVVDVSVSLCKLFSRIAPTTRIFPVENFEGTSRLDALALHKNQLTGNITSNICEQDIGYPHCGLDVLALHNNQLTGNITSNICEQDIGYLTADCDLISCSFCICYEKGQLVDNT